jgi:hypothetical protein
MTVVAVLFVPLIDTELGTSIGALATVGDAVGETVGDAVGETVGDAVGETVGEALGETVGEALGETVGEAVGETVGEALGETVGEALGETVGDAVAEGVGVGVGVDSVVACGADAPELPCPESAAIKPTPASPPTTSPIVFAPCAGNTVPSASSSFAIEHVKLSVFAGKLMSAYGALNCTAPTGLFVTSKNEYVTVELLTVAAGSNVMSGVKRERSPETSAAHETNFAGAFGCDATTPESTVFACASMGTGARAATHAPIRTNAMMCRARTIGDG